MTTIGGSIKSVIVTDPSFSVLNGQVFRDLAPDSATEPFVVFIEPIGNSSVLGGDAGVLYRKSLVQVELWQTMLGESDSLKKALVAALDGCRLPNNDTHVVRVRVSDTQRFPDPEYQEVHHVVTLEVTHANP